MQRVARLGITVAALAMLAGATVADPIDQPCIGIKPIATDIETPHWARQPNADEFANLYPPSLKPTAVEGRVALRCVVRADGTLADCVLLCEGPPGAGFGRATLSLARYFQLKPTLEDGRSVAGRTVVVRVRWKV